MVRVKIEIRKCYYLVYYEWRKIYIGNSSCYAEGDFQKDMNSMNRRKV